MLSWRKACLQLLPPPAFWSQRRSSYSFISDLAQDIVAAPASQAFVREVRRTYFLRVWYPDTRPSKQDVPIPWDACMFETEQENYGRHLTVETVELTMWPWCGFICTWCWYAGTESDNKMLTKLRKIKTKYTAADFELGERHLIKNEQVSLDRLRVRQNVFLVM